MSIIAKLGEIGEQALADVSKAATLEEIEKVRLQVLGKKGALSEVLKSLGHASPEERPKIGAAANEWKAKIETAMGGKNAIFEKLKLEEQLKNERIDVSLPAREPHAGSLHPVTQTTRKIIEVFSRLGFDVMTGPEVETDFLNFEAVNMPADHPARDMQDTFFMGPGVVLRTHTSAVQMRAMRSQKWPIRILCPGAVYRSDSDATHLPMFHQIEGLWVDKGVKMSDLKGTLASFAREIFGSDTKIRLRPSYFPFVEPGAEVDVSCFMCRTKVNDSCRLCKGTSWIEILGAGMVHPRLFEMAGYAEDYKSQGLTGFAFGMGVERVAMLLHGIPDLRLMVQGDTRFLRQF
jgi:phenylalanyl-tRNA synthetase alpha chain